jgi:hypothetical protein
MQCAKAKKENGNCRHVPSRLFNWYSGLAVEFCDPLYEERVRTARDAYRWGDAPFRCQNATRCRISSTQQLNVLCDEKEFVKRFTSLNGSVWLALSNVACVIAGGSVIRALTKQCSKSCPDWFSDYQRAALVYRMSHAQSNGCNQRFPLCVAQLIASYIVTEVPCGNECDPLKEVRETNIAGRRFELYTPVPYVYDIDVFCHANDRIAVIDAIVAGIEQEYNNIGAGAEPHMIYIHHRGNYITEVQYGTSLYPRCFQIITCSSFTQHSHADVDRGSILALERAVIHKMDIATKHQAMMNLLDTWFDLDACCVYLAGGTLYASERARRSLATRTICLRRVAGLKNAECRMYIDPQAHIDNTKTGRRLMKYGKQGFDVRWNEDVVNICALSQNVSIFEQVLTVPGFMTMVSNEHQLALELMKLKNNDSVTARLRQQIEAKIVKAIGRVQQRVHALMNTGKPFVMWESVDLLITRLQHKFPTLSICCGAVLMDRASEGGLGTKIRLSTIHSVRQLKDGKHDD